MAGSGGQHLRNEAVHVEVVRLLARGDDRDKQQLRAMQDAVAATAAELGLPEGLLASRKVLEALQDGGGWNGTLGGWRRAVLEPRLAPLLAG